MTVNDVRHMVKTYGIEHTVERVDVEEIEDQELRVLFRKYQNIHDDISAHLYLDTSDWYLKEEVL